MDLIDYARSLGGSPEDSEEAANDGLLAVHPRVSNSANRWRPEDPDPIRWAREATRNSLKDIWTKRNAKKRGERHRVDWPSDPVSGTALEFTDSKQHLPRDQAADSELGGLLDRALWEALDERERVVVNLYRLWGEEWQRIASHLGLRNRGRASEIFSRAKRNLRKWFDERGIALNDLLPDDPGGPDPAPISGDADHPEDKEE